MSEELAEIGTAIRRLTETMENVLDELKGINTNLDSISKNIYDVASTIAGAGPA